MLNDVFIKQEKANKYVSGYLKRINKIQDTLNFCLTEEHGSNLPFVRITKIILTNFKSVGHGEIVFSSGKKFIPYGTESDILGLYGQNGSGKTALINALELLRGMLIGVPYKGYSKFFLGYVKADSDFATIYTEFDLQYRDGRVRKVSYEFSLMVDSIKKKTAKTLKKEKQRVRFFNEKISMGGDFCGKKQELQLIIDMTKQTNPFVSLAKQRGFLGENKGLNKVCKYMKSAFKNSCSFAFMNEVLDYYKEKGNYSEFYQVLLELKYFALRYFFVIGTQYSGLIRLNTGIILPTQEGDIYLRFSQPKSIIKEGLDWFKDYFKKINIVLMQLVPGIELKVKTHNEFKAIDGRDYVNVSLNIVKNGLEFPLKEESDGTRRLISIMSLFILAFNCSSCTIVIDEFDAGIFEYLLGEIFEIFQESGKGQLIFTSHNLRPLEVLDKKYIYFTTTDPQNRYTQLKHVGKNDNLRDAYFREIILNSDEFIFRKIKKNKIIQALYDATPEYIKKAENNG